MAQHLLTGLLRHMHQDTGAEAGVDRRASAGLRARHSTLRKRLAEAAAALSGSVVPEPPDSLEFSSFRQFEVRAFSFSPEMLALPEAIVLAVVRRDRNCYCLRDGDGRLMPAGLLVEDSRALGAGSTQSQQAVEVRLRLALESFERTASKPLDESLWALSRVELHPRLGSLLDKVRRLRDLVPTLAAALREPGSGQLAPMDKAKRASLLCKVDLAFPLVTEYPELRGIAAAAIALRQGEHADVARAIASHHAPRHPLEAGPEDVLGALLQVADRLDTLAQGFVFGVMPTPTSDPLELRLGANQLVRTLIAHRFSWSLSHLIDLGLERLGGADGWLSREDTRIRLHGFLRHRLKSVLRQTFAPDEIHRLLLAEEVVPYQVHDALVGELQSAE